MIRHIYREAALQKLACPREVTSAKTDAAKLLSLLAGGDATTRYHAARALGEAADAKSAGPLMRLAADAGQDWNARRAALVALQNLKEKAAPGLPDLLTLLDDETLGYDAARTIGAIGPSVLPDVLKMAKEAKGRRLTALVEVMGFVGDPAAVPLLETLGAPKARGGQTAYKALARIGDDAAVAALGRLIVIDAMPVYQRGAVATALGETANPKALEVLQAARAYMKRTKRDGDGIDWGNFNWRVGNAERHLKGELKKKAARKGS
jgi:HEAT repeat protein